MPIAMWRVKKSGSGAVELLHTLDNPNAYGIEYKDYFGKSVAVCNSYSIVGVRDEDDSSGASSGKAYVFRNSTGELLYTLDNPYPTAGDAFGYSVSINETHAVVSAPGTSSVSGKAYVYSMSTGSLLYTLNNPNPYGSADNDFFGHAVSMSDSLIIVTATGEYNASWVMGAAYIFDIEDGSLLYTITNPNADTTSSGGDDDGFGRSAGICEAYAIVGAGAEDETETGENAGKAYIFSTSTGELLHTLDNPNAYGTSYEDYFGGSVAICDSFSIVGAPYEDDSSGAYAGKAYIFRNTTGELLYTLDNPNPSNYFGAAVSICEAYSIVGARYTPDGIESGVGKVYVYNNSTGALVYSIDNPNAYGSSGGDLFGDAVSICPTKILVGAPYVDGEYLSAGKAYMFSSPLSVATLIRVQ